MLGLLIFISRHCSGIVMFLYPRHCWDYQFSCLRIRISKNLCKYINKAILYSRKNFCILHNQMSKNKKLNPENLSDCPPDPAEYHPPLGIKISQIVMNEVLMNFSLIEPTIHITDENIEKWSVSCLADYRPSGDDIISFKTPRGVIIYMKVKNDKEEIVTDHAMSLISNALNMDLRDATSEVKARKHTKFVWPGIIFKFERYDAVNNKYVKDRITRAVTNELGEESLVIDLY